MAMHKPVAMVAALRSELGPLLRGTKARKIEGVEVYQLSSALVVLGGIGRNVAQRAAEIAVREAQPELLVSAGFAGALTPNLKAGDVVQAHEVVDEATGEHYACATGNAVLVSALRVAGVKSKQRLAATYAASAVDMEAAVVARIARQNGIAFAAVKAISDELDFAMPPVSGFVDAEGRFRALAFAGHVALRPQWWISTVTLARNSAIASRNLCAALQHLIEEHTLAKAGEQSIRS